MSVNDQALAVLHALNARNFEGLMAGFDDEAILDLPDGIRVVGSASLRDTLSAYVLRHDMSLEDFVVMTDEAGFRVGIECTLKGRNHRTVDAPAGNDSAYSLAAVVVLERGEERFSRLSLFTASLP
ncbi:hypothetical protein [Rhizobium sp. AAP43]|uniref:hypothetical protein n=1 Tax=Rhizobium sp. AAP43 TaxID=1523420 RepID=UPI0006B9AEAE|nr:hypothetical protein [Rhizobium sp. AAP43]KPF45435.1 hypothetical protein IP76_07715 [Rhizobium sp. AAP43]